MVPMTPDRSEFIDALHFRSRQHLQVARGAILAPEISAGYCHAVVMPKSTGPLNLGQQWLMIADNCGTSRKFRNLAGGVAVSPGFWRRTLLQGQRPRSLMPKNRVPPL